jgi:hypothetical protein
MVYSKTSLPARGFGSGGDSRGNRIPGWLSHTRKLSPVDGDRRRATTNKALISTRYSNEPAPYCGLGGRGELYLAPGSRLKQGKTREG